MKTRQALCALLFIYENQNRADATPTAMEEPSRLPEKGPSLEWKDRSRVGKHNWTRFPQLTWTWETIRTFRWIDQTIPEADLKEGEEIQGWDPNEGEDVPGSDPNKGEDIPGSDQNEDKDVPLAAVQYFGREFVHWLETRQKSHPHYPDEEVFARYQDWTMTCLWLNLNRLLDPSGTVYSKSPTMGLWPNDQPRPLELQVVPQDTGQIWAEDELLELQPKESDYTLEKWILDLTSKRNGEYKHIRVMLPVMAVQIEWWMEWQPDWSKNLEMETSQLPNLPHDNAQDDASGERLQKKVEDPSEERSGRKPLNPGGSGNI